MQKIFVIRHEPRDRFSAEQYAQLTTFLKLELGAEGIEIYSRSDND